MAVIRMGLKTEGGLSSCMGVTGSPGGVSRGGGWSCEGVFRVFLFTVW